MSSGAVRGDRLVSAAATALSSALKMPQPARLRRTDPAHVDDPLLPGPALVLDSGGTSAGADQDADTIAALLATWGVDVRRAAAPAQRLGAVVVVLTGLDEPGDLADPMLRLAEVMRDVLPSGRVVTVSRPAVQADRPERSAARQAVDGALRSVAKELRAGATGNGILLAPGVDVDAPSATGSLRFLLSARSAFVSGQLVSIGGSGGRPPEDWTRPLAGLNAVVTGAARGIGAAILSVLARDGARVVGVDVPAAGEGLARSANAAHGTALHLDITDPDATDRLLDHVLPRLGRIDAVVHNAGILRDKLLANMTREKWTAVIDVNLDAQLRINAALLAADALGPHPRLVSLASTSGIAGNRGQTNYAASKAGVIGMTRSLAPVLAERGGTANAVAPGFIETEMTAGIPAVPREIARRSNTLAQGGLPVDVAEAIAFLLAPQAGGINGQVLRVCGQNLVGR